MTVSTFEVHVISNSYCQRSAHLILLPGMNPQVVRSGRFSCLDGATRYEVRLGALHSNGAIGIFDQMCERGLNAFGKAAENKED